MKCIICDSPEANSIEHIVPEALGNKRYLLEDGICKVCNNKFSKFENDAVSSGFLFVQRSNHAIPTKKGKNAKGRVNGVDAQGDTKFKKDILVVNVEEAEKVLFYKTESPMVEIRIQKTDGSEAAKSKMCLKIGIESLFKSQNRIYKKYDFKELKDF